MGKKRKSRSDSEASDVEEDQAMDAADDDNNTENGDDEKMKEAESEELSSKTPQEKKREGMALKSGKRKRRRSVGTTGLTPPPTSKRATKKAKITTVDKSINGDKKPSAVAFASSGGSAQKSGGERTASTDDSPLANPRRISYSRARAHTPTNPSDEQSESSSEEEEPDEIDVVPPKQIQAHTNGTSQNDSEDVIEKFTPESDAQNENGNVYNEAMNADENDLSNDTSMASTGLLSTLQRLAMFVIFGYLSLLLTMPQVIKLSQDVVPLDDSILPPPEMTLNATSSEDVSDVDPSVALQAWNRQFMESLGKLTQAKTGYTSSKESFEEYYDELLTRVNNIATQIQPRQREIEERLASLNRLEELLRGTNKDLKTEGAPLAQELLGETLVSTSSIELWNMQDDTDVACDLGLEEDENDNDDSLVDETMEPLLLASLLEEKASNLILRSTISAEKFIGGPVAEDEIRTWVQSRIEEMIDDDEELSEAIEEIEKFPQLLSKSKTNTNTEQSDLQLTQIIRDRLDIHRADTTGIYDYASLKNGAEVIYGGKRGTSKSLIDELPVLNRILQNSNLRFYGFGPEAAMTATYPPNSLGQCWSFGQTSLKEQLKERKLFENDKKVKNDFKRGNFGTLTIRLSKPISVESIVIEHPPINTPGQANSAIRKFRVVGYEDELATSKSWNLGSFEYNLRENRENNKYLQTFEAATTVFGKEIPPLHSISLAVDSNNGHDYSCLYRFRVHGK